MPPSAESEAAASGAAAPDLLVEALEVRDGRGRVLLTVDRLMLRAGQSLAVQGPSGAGKSTLLHVLSGLIRPATGRVIWGGTDIAALPEPARAAFRRNRLGLIFQDYNLFEELPALGNAALAAAFAPARNRAALRDRAAGWLDRLGLGAAGGRTVASFSGGERQRIAVARALATDPPVILADEPTASLDRAAADALGADLARLARDGGRTLVAVTHDAALAGLLQRRLTIADGRVVEDSDA